MRNILKKEGAANEAEKIAWLRLIRTENIGPITFFNVIDRYGSAEKALAALPELAAKGGRKKPLIIPARGAVEREYEAVKRLGGDIILACEESYPLALSALEDAPPVITVLGNPALMNKPCTGIVGARNASLNGRKFAAKLARDLGEAGQVIVSGLARGIDTAAHEGALVTGTIAVIAGGIDVVYPSENQRLYDSIREKGLIIAENPLSAAPRAQDFPRRNRIVSGLSQGVVVVEATLRSGSLITARLAGEQGRDVYAVPGHPLDPRAEGPNALIRDGATLVRNAADVLENLAGFSGGGFSDRSFHAFDRTGIPEIANDFSTPRSFDEARTLILNGLSFAPAGIDDILRAANLDAALAQTVLMELELEGLIRRLPGNRAMLIDDASSGID